MLINLKIILKFMKKGYNRKLHKKTINEKIYDFKLFILCNFKYFLRDFYIGKFGKFRITFISF